MLINKEQFRNFERNLLVFFGAKKAPAAEPAAKPKDKKPEAAKEPEVKAKLMDYTGFKGDVTKKLSGEQKPKSGNEFRSKKSKALASLRKIHLDAALTEKSAAEEGLEDYLKGHIEKEFTWLEHNYQERLKIVGRGPENEKAMEARNTLNKSADKFIFEMEMYVLTSSVDSKDGQGARMAKIRLIDGYTKVPGFGQHFLDGNSDVLDTLFSPEPKNQKEFNARLEKKLDNEDLLEEGIRKMIEKTPKFKDRTGVLSVFNKLIKDSITKAESGNPKQSPTYYLGTENQEDLAKTLAKRFNIVPSGSDKPEYYVDLMNGNKVYKANQIDAVILRLSQQSEFRSPDKLEDYREKIDEAAEDQAELHSDLLSGDFWAIGEGEVTGLSTLRDNEKLSKLIADTARYENVVEKDAKEIAEQLAKFDALETSKEAQAALDGVRGKLNPNSLRGNKALGNAKALVALLKLVSTLADNGNFDGLGEVAAGIDDEENPAEASEKAKVNYEKMLKGAKLTDLLSAHIAPKSQAANKLFSEDKAKKMGVDPKQLSKYRHLAAKPAIEEHLIKELGFKNLLQIKKTADGAIQFDFEKKDGTDKLLTIKTVANELVITDFKKNEERIPNTIQALKTALKDGFKKKAEEAEKKTDKIPTHPRYIKDGVLQNVSKASIHNVLPPNKYEEVVITLGPKPRTQKFKSSEKHIKLIPRNNTYVIADGQSNPGRRLYVYDGDIIKSVEAKKKK